MPHDRAPAGRTARCLYLNGVRVLLHFVDDRSVGGDRTRGGYPLPEAVAARGSADAVTVLVVDGQPVFRLGLATLLELEPWVGRVHVAGSVAQAARVATATHPDLAVVDLQLPHDGGIAVLGRLAVAVPGCRTAVLAGEVSARLEADAIAAGATGVLLKSAEPDVLASALRVVAAGGSALTGRTGAAGSASRPDPLERLSPRRRQLAELVGEGRSNPQIARLLGISEKTVRNALSAVLVELGVPDRVNLALLAREAGDETGRETSRRTLDHVVLPYRPAAGVRRATRTA